eukprot:1377119-Rhodomonas_salina.2
MNLAAWRVHVLGALRQCPQRVGGEEVFYCSELVVHVRDKALGGLHHCRRAGRSKGEQESDVSMVCAHDLTP